MYVTLNKFLLNQRKILIYIFFVLVVALYDTGAM
jgi:hypothetical protein